MRSNPNELKNDIHPPSLYNDQPLTGNESLAYTNIFHAIKNQINKDIKTLSPTQIAHIVAKNASHAIENHEQSDSIISLALNCFIIALLTTNRTRSSVDGKFYMNDACKWAKAFLEPELNTFPNIAGLEQNELKGIADIIAEVIKKEANNTIIRRRSYKIGIIMCVLVGVIAMILGHQAVLALLVIAAASIIILTLGYCLYHAIRRHCHQKALESENMYSSDMSVRQSSLENSTTWLENSSDTSSEWSLDNVPRYTTQSVFKHPGSNQEDFTILDDGDTSSSKFDV